MANVQAKRLQAADHHLPAGKFSYYRTPSDYFIIDEFDLANSIVTFRASLTLKREVPVLFTEHPVLENIKIHSRDSFLVF